MLKSSRLVFFDIETTGLKTKEDHIIEIGAIRYVTSSWKPVGYFNQLIKPPSFIPPEITELTGIQNDQVVHCPDAMQVIGSFWSWLNNDPLAGHNVNSFDWPFVKRYFDKYHLVHLGGVAVDTLELSREKHKNLPNHKLDTLIEHYGIERAKAHRAMDDARATAEVYFKMMGFS